MRRRLTARHLVAAGATLAVTAAILPPATAAIDDPVGSTTAPVTTDSRDRDSVLAPTQAQLDAVRALVAAAPKGARATWDERFGTPRSLVGSGAYLTGARSGSAADVARGWVAENQAAFGMADAQVADLVVSRDHELPGTGTHVVTLTQVFGGVEAVHGGRLNVAVTKDGKVLSYAGNPTRGTGLAGGFSLSPAEALDTVAASLAPGQELTPKATGEQAGYTTFAKGPFAAGSNVKKVAFPTDGGARAAFRVLFVEKMDEAYDVVVDAQSGKELFRDSLVDHVSEGTVY
jgi:hypothetical protein